MASFLNMYNKYSLLYSIIIYIIIFIACVLDKKNLSIKTIVITFFIYLSFLNIILLINFNDFVFNGRIEEFSLNLCNNSNLILPISLNIKIDALSYLFILLVSTIGLSTIIYTLDYFKYESNADNFILLINWFIISMIFLVISNNFFSIFLGWESIGLSSFFLINFWNTRRGTIKSSFKAFFFNKISDVFLLITLVLIWYSTKITNINSINLLIFQGNLMYSNKFFYATICLIICSCLKSAQILTHLWLPDSMEAPVPASALIHSATLVSAGVYLLLRFKYLIEIVQLENLLLYIGSLTAAYGGIVSAAQTDVKKLLAYSTISHCGFLFICCALNNDILTITYLYLHGIFKAMSFFCIGTFIRISGSQDSREMGNMSTLLPIDSILLIISSTNLGGIPFSIGFFYKDLFFCTLLNHSVSIINLGFIFIGLLSGAIYTFRLIYYTCFDCKKTEINITIQKIQSSFNNNINNWTLSTKLNLISCLLLLLFSIWSSIIFIKFIININVTYDLFPLIFEGNPTVDKSIKIIYKNYFNIFYGLYLSIICFMSILSWRNEFTFGVKVYFLLYICMFIITLNIIFKLFFFLN